jgi:hypothetical protein
MQDELADLPFDIIIDRYYATDAMNKGRDHMTPNPLLR